VGGGATRAERHAHDESGVSIYMEMEAGDCLFMRVI
jgi:hypothetical protein